MPAEAVFTRIAKA